MKFKAIIFDLDGTLVDSLPDIGESLNTVLQDHGFPRHPIKKYLDFVGDGVDKMVNRAFFGHDRFQPETEKYIKAYRELYGERLTRKTSPYAGIDKLIEACAMAGLKIAVLSNKPEKATQRIVSELLSPDRFHEVWGEREDIGKKPDPSGAIALARKLDVSPEHCLFVGDMPVDVIAAIRAKMYPAGALWGYRSAGELLEAGARILISRPADLIDWM